MRRSKLGFVLVAMTILNSSHDLEAGAKRVPLEREDLLGVWIGLTADDLELIRLDLDPEGNGALGFQFKDGEPCVLGLRSWSLAKGRVTFDFVKNTDCAATRDFHGVALGNTLELTVKGSGWKRRALLKREEPLVDSWQKLKAAMVDVQIDK
jgi:hypothetical protein